MRMYSCATLGLGRRSNSLATVTKEYTPTRAEVQQFEESHAFNLQPVPWFTLHPSLLPSP